MHHPGAMSERHHVAVIIPLRGIASFAVAWSHFTNVAHFLPDGWLKGSGRHGWLGVEMFFVISGFVIPWSLYTSGYRRNAHWPRFLLKRIARLDPPYLASIALTLGIAWFATLAPNYHGERVVFTWPQLFAHLGYANAVMHYGWFNPVYWTLAIEAMWYLLVAAMLPFFLRRSWLMALYVALAVAPYINSNPNWIFGYLPIFGMGIAVFQLFAGILQPKGFAIALAALATSSLFVIDPKMTVAGLVTAGLIATRPAVQFKPLAALGALSYSLYLVHWPIGEHLINFAMRYAQTTASQIAVLALVTATSLGAAWLLWRFVELPAQRLSSSIRYHHGRSAEVVTGTVAFDPKAELELL